MIHVSTFARTPADAPTLCDSPLRFSRFKLSEMGRVSSMLAAAPARTCDFTIGGIYMWTDYFRYRRAFNDDTLFIRGLSELDITREAYSLPIGALPLRDSIALLRRHCDSVGEELRLSAVPEEAVASLISMGGRVDAELTDWADYLYDISPMATFAGKKMAKKRNHVNAFMAENPGYTFEPLTPANLPAVREFFGGMHLAADKGITAEVERMKTLEVLDHAELYPFEGAVLATPAHGIVAFTLGEVRDDTLFVHIEKMRHDVNGAGETVAHLFAERMLAKHPALRYVNREEDAGDEGLRRAKQSYHPARLLRKFDIIF